ncbi:hypothetical protein BT69DRAFT_1358081 [Atractiella rhizophila]|nr:hypothetical protein BT69DRAFT_1358081 [Atractiella rhizophila]
MFLGAAGSVSGAVLSNETAGEAVYKPWPEVKDGAEAWITAYRGGDRRVLLNEKVVRSGSNWTQLNLRALHVIPYCGQDMSAMVPDSEEFDAARGSDLFKEITAAIAEEDSSSEYLKDFRKALIFATRKGFRIPAVRYDKSRPPAEDPDLQSEPSTQGSPPPVPEGAGEETSLFAVLEVDLEKPLVLERKKTIVPSTSSVRAGSSTKPPKKITQVKVPEQETSYEEVAYAFIRLALLACGAVPGEEATKKNILAWPNLRTREERRARRSSRVARLPLGTKSPEEFVWLGLSRHRQATNWVMGGQRKGGHGKPDQLYVSRTDGAIVVMLLAPESSSRAQPSPVIPKGEEAEVEAETEDNKEITVKDALAPLRDATPEERVVHHQGKERLVVAAESQPVIQIETKTSKHTPYQMLPQQDAELIARALKPLKDQKYIDLSKCTDFYPQDEAWLISFRGLHMHFVKTIFTADYLAALVRKQDLEDLYRDDFQSKELDILDPGERADAFYYLTKLLCYHRSPKARQNMRVLHNAYKSL